MKNAPNSFILHIYPQKITNLFQDFNIIKITHHERSRQSSNHQLSKTLQIQFHSLIFVFYLMHESEDLNFREI